MEPRDVIIVFYGYGDDPVDMTHGWIRTVTPKGSRFRLDNLGLRVELDEQGDSDEV